MSRKALNQYLEMLSNSGIESIFISKENYREEIVEHDKEALLEANREKYQNCQKCNLFRQRIKFVYGEGDPCAKLMLIGEGPGSEENKQGRPFVGKAGQLLTRMLQAIEFDREEVYITNIVKCQPPGNRNPLPEEVNSCLPYLREQIKIISPKLLVLLGKVAAFSLFGISEPLSVLRQKVFDFEHIETYITYHPAALIYNSSLKKHSWIDLQKIRKRYDSLK